MDLHPTRIGARRLVVSVVGTPLFLPCVLSVLVSISVSISVCSAGAAASLEDRQAGINRLIDEGKLPGLSNDAAQVVEHLNLQVRPRKGT